MRSGRWPSAPGAPSIIGPSWMAKETRINPSVQEQFSRIGGYLYPCTFTYLIANKGLTRVVFPGAEAAFLSAYFLNYCR